jgi:hypothetical protein
MVVAVMENIATLVQMGAKIDESLSLYGLLEAMALLLMIGVGAYLVYKFVPKLMEEMI